ncbi:Zinc finger MYM-type protein 1-like [Oopsacas minuta]|uniref:Zinc finger MYM-type protein 1-like n=1 Tax=Oopsacas minuta TaxID=111878 RepID=A0AAV7KE59_9METZ|nr:Zinc finger MYM-type protein 1-like [Oopsacas minuta]
MCQTEKREHAIILLKGNKHSVKEISRNVGVSLSTVYNLKSRISECLPIERRKRSGRPGKLLPLITKSIAQQIRRTPYISLRAMADKCPVTTSKNTIARALEKLRYAKPYPSPIPQLSEKNRISRLEWAEKILVMIVFYGTHCISRKFNISNSSQLTLFTTYKRIKLTSENDIDITYDNNDPFREAQEPDFVPTCDTTNLVSFTPIEPPLDIAQGPNDKPVQPSRHTCRFPSTSVGTKKRQFNPEWFVTFSWFEYSVERDAGFLYQCCIFNAVSGRTEDAFKSVGFKDWKHATGRDGTLHFHGNALRTSTRWLHGMNINKMTGLIH